MKHYRENRVDAPRMSVMINNKTEISQNVISDNDKNQGVDLALKKPILDNTATIAERIRLLREARGLKQEQLAELCGWGGDKKKRQARISHYENNRRTPGLEEIQKLAVALGVKPEVLLFGVQPKGKFYSAARELPILEWQQLRKFKNGRVKPNEIKGVQDFRLVPLGVPASVNAFMLRVAGRTMEPEFHDGDMVVVDPERQPSPDLGDRQYVVVSIGGQTPVLRQYVTEGDQHFFKALDKSLPATREDTSTVTYGVVLYKVTAYTSQL